MSNKKSGTGSKITYVILVTLIVLLLLVVVGFFAKFTNNFTSGFATFYVEHNDKTIISDKGGFAFDLNTEYSFNVGYSLDFVNKEKLGYSVEITPNITEDTDFVIETDDSNYKFSDIGDLTEYFTVTQYESYFTLRADKTLSEIIKAVYGDTATGVPFVDGSKDYLLLTVYSEDKSTAINLAFNATVPAEGLTPNYGHIVAG